MPITRDIRELLAVSPGRAPDHDNDVLSELVGHWAEAQREKRADYVRSSTAPFFASDGAGCARRASYDYLTRTFTASVTAAIEAAVDDDTTAEQLADIRAGVLALHGLTELPERAKPGVPDLWRFRMGDLVHDEIQSIGEAAGFENEVRAVLTDDDGNDLVSTRADMVRVKDGVYVELKSAGGFKFKKASTTFSGGPEGPGFAYVVQMALTVKSLLHNGLPIKRAVICFLALENISPKLAADYADSDIGRFGAQWSYTVDELVELADEVIAHLVKIKSALDAGIMPPRVFKDPEIPAQAVVVAPSKGAWQVTSTSGEVLQAGSTWMCDYCDWREQCLADLEAGV